MSTANLEPVKSILLAPPVAASQLHALDAVERSAGFLLLALTAPVTIFSAAAIALVSGRSPLVAHLRIGRNDEPFWMWKLRTMWGKGEATRRERGWIEYIVAEPNAEGKQAADSRVTSRFAAFCRRHSIDELPQLWHVARGEMALVGPRPLTRSELLRHYGAHSRELLSVKPGLTGLWQVSGRSYIRFPQRALLDLELVCSLTPRMYLKIVLKTFSALIYGKGAW